MSPDYLAYIASEDWRRNPARLLELHLAHYRCRVCDRGWADVPLEVHHRTYRRLRRERVEDLLTLCVDCHDAVTAMLRARREAPRAPRPGECRRGAPSRYRRAAAPRTTRAASG